MQLEWCSNIWRTRKEVTLEKSVPMKPKTMRANFLDFSHSRGSAVHLRQQRPTA